MFSTRFLQVLCMIISLSSFFYTTIIEAQTSSKNKSSYSVNEYIDEYKGIAVNEMRRSKVPASITLAQAILESRSGNSFLAKKANNHFGIKCHRSWSGPKQIAKDDRPTDCFRKYSNEYASYRDHSNFLNNNDRYSFLFDYEEVDYKTWAHGLKTAGYATDVNYADHLIYLIEKYKLNQFDVFMKEGECGEVIMAMTSEFNGVKTAIFNCLMTLDHVAQAYHISKEQLIRYNNFQHNDFIEPNTMIYLEEPLRKASWVNQERRKPTNHNFSQVADLYGINTGSTPAPDPVLHNSTMLAETKTSSPKSGSYTVSNPHQNGPYDQSFYAYKQAPQTPMDEIFADAMSRPIPRGAGKVAYTVQRGDTLYSLSRKFRTTIASIKATNNLTTDMLRVGQSLRIFRN